MKLMQCLLIGALSVSLIACGGKTPQDTFTKLKAAQEKKDHKAMASCLTSATLDKMNLGLTLVAGFATMGKDFKPDPAKEKELDAIFAKHGLKDLKKQKSKEDAEKTMASIKDKPGLYADLITFIEKNSKKGSFNMPEFVELKDVKVEGETATGKLVSKRKGKDGKDETKTEDVTFKNVNGEWLMHIEMSRKKKKPAKK